VLIKGIFVPLALQSGMNKDKESSHINELAARQITPSPHYTRTSYAQARVLQPFPPTRPGCKTHAYCLPELCLFDNFIMTRQLLPIYLDFATLQLYHDTSTPACLPRLFHLDKFIVT